jgi:hypothetical protein
MSSPDPFAGHDLIWPGQAQAADPDPFAGHGFVKSGLLPNLAAGGNEAMAGILGAPVDAANFALGGLDTLYNWAAGGEGRHLSSDAPVGGSQSIMGALGTIGADPRAVAATTPAERVARAGAGGAVSLTLPAAAARAAIGAGVGAGSRLVAPLLEGVAGPAPTGPGTGALLSHAAASAAIGAGAGVGGKLAADAVPEDAGRWKPLAEFAGEMAGGGAVAGTIAGAKGLAGIAVDAARDFARPFTEGGRQEMVGAELLSGASDPRRFRAALENDHPELVPGSAPTTFQLTGDSGIGQLERAASRQAPAPFLERLGEQNAARTRLVDELAPDGRPAAVGEHLRAELDRITREHDARIADALGQRESAIDALGGTGSPQHYGADLRTALEQAKATEKAAASRLYAQVDPDQALALDIAPIQQAAAEIRTTLPKAAVLEPLEARLHEVIAAMPEVERFREVFALRSELLDAIRNERHTAGETQALRRMTRLQGAIDDAIGGFDPAASPSRTGGATNIPGRSAGGLTPPPQEGPSGNIGGSAARGDGAMPQVAAAVYDRAGSSFPVRYRVVEADGLQTAAGALQPRDRSRAASGVQVAEIARKLNPDKLGASAELGIGAPLIHGTTVIDGNGRLLALREAYRANGPAGQSYRAWVERQYPEAAGMKAPVLVKALDPGLSGDTVLRLAREANSPPGMSLSATERAVLDAEQLSPEVLGLYRGGDIADSANGDFVRAFLRSVPAAEHNGLVTADRQLSSEGAVRLRNALLQAAYDDHNLVAALTETGHEGMRNLGGALMDAAPAWAGLRAGAASGAVRPEMDITPSVREAVRLSQAARRQGVPLADMVAQRDAFAAADPLAHVLLREVHGDSLSGRVNRRQLAGVLRAYADLAGQQTNHAVLFDELPVIMPDQILEAVRRRHGRATETEAQPAGAVGVRPGGGADRPEAPGPGHGAAGPGVSAAGGGAGRGRSEVLPEGLTATFDASAAERYRAANAAYRDYAETFKGGSVGAVLKADKGSGYQVPDSDVASRFFHAQKRSVHDIEAFARAAGSNPAAVDALLEYAVAYLRRAALRPDGSIDPGKWRKWMDAHYEALRALDALSGNGRLRQRFSRTSEAQVLVDQLGGDKLRSLEDYQAGAVNLFLGTTNDADTVKAVKSALGAGNPAAAMAGLVRRVSGDPDALAGLRRAVVDLMRRDLTGNAEAGTTGLAAWKSDAFQGFLKQHRPALRSVFADDQLAAMKAVADDLRRANRSVAGSRLPGGSDTAQNAAAMARRPASALWHLMLGAMGGGVGGELAGVGSAAGGFAGALLQLGREAGLKKLDALLTEALLNPSLARDLVRTVSPHNAASLGEHLRQRLVSLALIQAPAHGR